MKYRFQWYELEAEFVLLESEKLVAKDFTQPAELCVALVLQAELEGLFCDHAVHLRELDIVSQNLKNVAVCLPQKLEPWRHELAICPVLVGLVRHIAEHEILRALLLVQVVNLLNHCLQGAAQGFTVTICAGDGTRRSQSEL